MGYVFLCISSLLFDSKGPSQVGRGPGRHDTHSAGVDDGGLVSTNTTAARRGASTTSQRPGSTKTDAFRDIASTSQNVATHGSQYLREAIEAKGIYGKANEIICGSWRWSTQKQYHVYIEKWNVFCKKRKTNPLCTTVVLIVDFLMELFEAGLGYSAINTARSALSAYTSIGEDGQIGNDPIISRFVRGIFQIRTPLPKYTNTLDVEILHKFFMNQKDNEEMTLKDLTRKLCALILIESAQRIQTIHLIKCKFVHIYEDRCVIGIVDPLKSTRPDFHQEPLELEQNENKKICVINCLKVYIERTAPYRKGFDQLLLTYAKPHEPVSKDSVARWMKELLTDAGIIGFDAHSFRSASSSYMLRKGIPMTIIMRKAGWSNEKTFNKFYNRETVQTKKKNSQRTLLNFFK